MPGKGREAGFGGLQSLEQMRPRNPAKPLSSVLLFLAEFLEARIVAERIEHRIEPEQSGGEWGSCPKSFALLFRRERGDDFLEARVAAQRIPHRI